MYEGIFEHAKQIHDHAVETRCSRCWHYSRESMYACMSTYVDQRKIPVTMQFYDKMIAKAEKKEEKLTREVECLVCGSMLGPSIEKGD